MGDKVDVWHDAVILGTGLTECVLSGLLGAKKGAKVLHMDRNDNYGGESASVTLKSLFQKYGNYNQGEEPWKKYGRDYDWNIDLVPKLIMANGGLKKMLVATGVYVHLEIGQIAGSYVQQGAGPKATVAKVPSDAGEALRSSLMGLFEKRRARNFLEFVGAYDESKPATHKIKHLDLNKNTMKEFYDYFGLEPNTRDFIGHSMALYQTDDYINQKEMAIDAVERIRLYVQSMATHGKSPYIYPRYGLGELPQVFSRLSAVHGGTYMLNADIDQTTVQQAEDVAGFTEKVPTVLEPVMQGNEQVKKDGELVYTPVYAELKDERGNVVYETFQDANGQKKLVELKNAEGSTVYETLRDREGQPLKDSKGEPKRQPKYLPKYTLLRYENGQPVHELLKDGNGEPLKNDKGQPSYVSVQIKDYRGETVKGKVWHVNATRKGLDDEPIPVETYCRKIFADPSYFPGLVHVTGYLLKAICILNHPIASTDNSDSIQLIIPQSQIGRKHDIYIAVVSHEHLVCPAGYYVAIVSTIAEGDSNHHLELQAGFERLGKIEEKFMGPPIPLYAPNDSGEKEGIFISKSYDATSHFETTTDDIQDLWRRAEGEKMVFNQDNVELVKLEDGADSAARALKQASLN